jgi:DNA-binding CsgD family transcriptional regulator
MAAYDREFVRAADLSPLEIQIGKEKAKGLSNLEVALKLCLYERDVRAVTRRLKKRYDGPTRLRDTRRHGAHQTPALGTRSDDGATSIVTAPSPTGTNDVAGERLKSQAAPPNNEATNE